MAKNVKNIVRVSLSVYSNNRFKDIVEDSLVYILYKKKQVQKQSLNFCYRALAHA